MLEIQLGTPMSIGEITKIEAVKTTVNHRVTEQDNPLYAATVIQFLDESERVLRTVTLDFTKSELDAWNDDDNYLLQQAYAKLQAQGLI